MALTIVNHPLAAHLLAGLRDKNTPPERFRRLCKSLTTIVVLEATVGIRTRESNVMTPLKETSARLLDQPLAAAPVLRAGLGMLEAVLELFPDVAVGYIGLEREESTAIARSYYSKLPNLKGCFTMCLDPMLATGGSAGRAISLLKDKGPDRVTMVSIVAAPEGVARLSEAHPDVDVVTAALDECLDARKYIVPGLGDFGDRLYGTF